jgi:hypothetical protein
MNVLQMKAHFWSLYREFELTVTADHLKLLRHAYVSWSDGEGEDGAPTIDPYFPYGSDQLCEDMARILGMPDAEWQDEQGNPTAEAERRFAQLHVETAVALQIALATAEFRTGHYYDDGNQWRRADDQPSGGNPR